MSGRTTSEQVISDKIVERLRAQSNPNTTVLIDTEIDSTFTTFQDTVANQLATDAQITSRKSQTIPATFGTSDGAIVIANNRGAFIDDIKTKLRRASDVRFIVVYNVHIEDDEFENFGLISSERVQRTGGNPADTFDFPVKVFQREKVYV